ncbi:MAG: exo-beta-N-acetylmuramidase NamZ family protein [Arachnia sp.]
MTTSRRNLFRATGIAAAAGAASGIAIPAVAQAPAVGSDHGLLNGADVASADGWSIVAGRRVGIITNPTGVLKDFTSIVDDMVAQGVDVGAVFGPEHGFRGTAQAGSSEPTSTDPRTGVTVYDAYGADATKFAGFYTDSGVDTVVFDIQDAGARFYTYIWTMWSAMQAASTAGVSFMVMDRPNPLGGRARGPVLQSEFASGVGQLEIAQQHGMTVGELARYFNASFMTRLGLAPLDDVEVVQVQGWKREMDIESLADRWVLPSPNMPSPRTTTLYPGTGLFEATNMSEGRGTTLPFELIGAPYGDHQWAADLNARRLEGVEFREAYFVPTFSKNQGQVCGGVQVHVLDPEAVDAPAVGTHMLVAARDLYGEFDWRGDAGRWIDLLTGSDRFRTQFEAGASATEIISGWKRELRRFVVDTNRFLLYPGPR